VRGIKAKAGGERSKQKGDFWRCLSNCNYAIQDLLAPKGRKSFKCHRVDQDAANIEIATYGSLPTERLAKLVNSFSILLRCLHTLFLNKMIVSITWRKLF